MRIRVYVPVILHRAMSASLVAVFLFYSAPMIYHELLSKRIGTVEPNHSIDTYLRGLTGIPNGSQQLGEALDRLPLKKPLVIFTRNENAQSEFLGMLLGYLSWPREIRIVEVVGPAADKDVAAIDPASAAGLAFCSVNPPPWLGKGIHLGSSVVLVPTPDAK